MSSYLKKAMTEKGIDEDLVEDILSIEQQRQQVINSVTNINKELVSNEFAYTERKKALKSALADVQKTCPHGENTYHPDASGNNDSYRTCDWCEAEI